MSTNVLSPASSDAGLVVLIEDVSFREAENTCKSQNRVWLLGLDEATKKMTVLHPGCGSWSCSHCARELAKQWIERTVLMVEQTSDSKPFDLVTLTLSEKLPTFEACLKVFPDAWRRLYAALKRAQNDFSYVLVPELHKNARVHVHIVTNYVVPETYVVHRKRKANKQVKRMNYPEKMDRFWKDLPRAYGWGYANDQEHIEGDSGKAAYYVSKYLAKQRRLNNWPKHFKHVRHSSDVPDIPEQPDDLNGLSWLTCLTEDRLIEKISAYRRAGWRLFEPHTGEVLS